MSSIEPMAENASAAASSTASTKPQVSDAQRKIQGQPAMEKLIPMINQLQEVFSTLGASSKIDLPQIVVVGSQSAGKSSVLESICHRDFLPRGSGIVTRRPLILQLNTIPAQPEGKPQEWAYFMHNKEKKFTDFNEICKEIEAETERLAGDGQCVSDKPIGLRLYSPHVLNLTLVDLPGIARNPVGDQPKNIETLIKEMVMKFISKENALILAVSAANQDLATSDAISMAQRVDPNGDRTIGVLTKLDLMDRGTDAYNVLINKECPLKLGWTGVVNRSQAAIDEKQSIQTARFEEMKFFLNHPKYRTIADQQGTDYLCTKLNRILIRHIQKTLPGLRERINDLTLKYQQEMDSYGATIEEAQRGATLLNIISHYSVAYCNTIDGRNYNLESKKLEGGSRINYIFTRVVRAVFDEVKIGDIANPEAIRTVIRNASGTQATLFFPEHAIDVFVNRILLSLEKPSQRIIDMVVTELITISKDVCSSIPELQRFARINSEITDLAGDLIRELAEPAHKFIKNIIECELSFVNTMHPDFINNLDTNQITSGSGNNNSASLGGVVNNALSNPNNYGPNKVRQNLGMNSNNNNNNNNNDENPWVMPDQLTISGPLSDSEALALKLVPAVLDSYFTVIRKKTEDTIPKAAIRFLVNESKTRLQRTLISKMYNESRMSYLFDEDPEIAQKRTFCRDMLRMLRKAAGVIEQMMGIN